MTNGQFTRAEIASQPEAWKATPDWWEQHRDELSQALTGTMESSLSQWAAVRRTIWR